MAIEYHQIERKLYLCENSTTEKRDTALPVGMWRAGFPTSVRIMSIFRHPFGRKALFPMDVCGIRPTEKDKLHLYLSYVSLDVIIGGNVLESRATIVETGLAYIVRAQAL